MRLESRVVWILERDGNSKFFQKFSNGHRNMNSIWDLIDCYGNTCTSDAYLKVVVVPFFYYL